MTKIDIGAAGLPPFIGRTFCVKYGEAMTALNVYGADGRTMSYEVTAGPFAGSKAQVQYEATQVAPGIYALSWKEADGGTVVHVDNFIEGTSRSYYTTPTSEFVRMSGTLERVGL